MTRNREDLLRLVQLAQLVRDRDLARLGTASAQKQKTQSLLAALDSAQVATGLDPVVASQIEDRFGLWVNNRRILLNQQLARDTVGWMAARAEAQTSFGRADVLGKLLTRR